MYGKDLDLIASHAIVSETSDWKDSVLRREMATIVSSTFNFEKLDGAANYSAWATNAMYTLIDKDFWEVTEGSEGCPAAHSGDSGASAEWFEGDKIVLEWSKKNNRAWATTVLSVRDGPKAYIQAESTAVGAFSATCSVIASKLLSAADRLSPRSTLAAR